MWASSQGQRFPGLCSIKNQDEAKSGRRTTGSWSTPWKRFSWRTVVTDARTPNKNKRASEKRLRQELHSRAQEDPEGSQRWSLFLPHITILPTPSPGNHSQYQLGKKGRREGGNLRDEIFYLKRPSSYQKWLFSLLHQTKFSVKLKYILSPPHCLG